ncbi:MAG: EAL domain-containing protein [Thiobacillus sp.]|uniref:putative bifunctional diguanylate cyclase/phosphodiesterase n=1 Tax=Thiobacillus sp. TaxID=924 RepID=UPI002893E34E|nr:EAL domain-containing protein [Thiobacillus sp.]MDT3707972.1 EAL domain-containing protein [Thiobacillus sp.]
MDAIARFIQAHVARGLERHTAWRLALLAGFVTQLLLILFVTTIALQQLKMATDNLKWVVDFHMRKQNLTKTMVVAARERTMLIFMLSKTDDAFVRDSLLMQFHQKGAEFVTARLALLDMPLSPVERELIVRQRDLIAFAQPLQEQAIDLIAANLTYEAANLVLEKVIPAQNKVLAVLSQLDAEAQRVARVASNKAYEDHRVARSWMYLLSGVALFVGFLVAAVVLRYTTRIGREREHLATQDALTGLPNRMLLEDRLEQALARGRRRRRLVGVMFIDLDRFKRVNDTLGHASGDQLISEVAQRLGGVARAEDTVARLGGDEFVVVVSEAGTVGHIMQVAEKIRTAMAAPYMVSGHELFCSSSIGISVYPNDGTDSSSLLKNADTAMYHAKSAGRDRFQLYDAGMNAMAGERLQLETDLHYALERSEFLFYYQPQINLETGRIQTVEALIRWNHPAKGMLAPAAFLEMLEETGEIISVGRRLLMEACSQAASWHAAGFADLRVAVNISSKEFWHTSLVSSVRTSLERSGLPAHALLLELTEGIFMEDIDSAIDRVNALKTLGIAIAVDDFGTGYSSLAHLKRFPLDALKIDRYFVKDLPNTVNEALVRSILALCEGLHLDAIAEGVENRQQLDCLQRLGCQLVQGFVLSEPLPPEQLSQFLDQGRPGQFGQV